ncbi:MAG: hypothetical protein ACT4PV_04320 [Planctomycetaceae bacterium]
MPVLRALLRFPLDPGAAMAELGGRTRALFAPLLPASAAALYFGARGCGAGDALAAGAALLLLNVGAGAGGAGGAALAQLLLARPVSFLRLWPACSLFATWAALLYPSLLVLLSLLGAGSTTPLTAALILLAWGVASGTGVVAGDDEEAERGRLLVGSCLGAGGALAGLVLAALFARSALVAAGPAAPGREAIGLQPGEPVLLRPGSPPFFRFGGAWGGTALPVLDTVPAKVPPKPVR